MTTTWYFLRGLVRESAHWNGFDEQFQAAFPGCKVVTLDLPGTGKYFRSLSPKTISEAVEALRKDYTPSDNAHFLAVSLGGMIGFEWLRKHPEDFRSAVIINSSLRGLSPLFDRLRPHNYWNILRIGLSTNFHLREKKILEMTTNRPDLVQQYLPIWTEWQNRRPVSRRSAIRQLQAAARFRAYAEKPKTPVLLLTSYADRLVSYRCSEAIAKTYELPIHYHGFGGHDLTLDAPEWVIDRIANFQPSSK